MKYTRKELNSIVANINIDELYLAVVEKINKNLKMDEIKDISKSDNGYFGENKERAKDTIDELSRSVDENEILKNHKDDIMSFVFALAQIRFVTVIAVIDDQLYNVSEGVFLRRDQNKIIYYESLKNYLNPNTCKYVLVDHNDSLSFAEPTVVLDSDDPSGFYEFEAEHIDCENQEDLTEDLILEISGPKLTIQKRKK